MPIISLFPQRKLVPIPNLIRIVLEFIYEPKNTQYSSAEIERMIIHWVDWVKKEKDKQARFGDSSVYTDPRPVGTKGTEWDEAEFWIMWCSQRLVQAEAHTGEVARNRRDIIEFGLEWKKLYKLPEAYTAEDFAKAMAYLKRAQEENPSDYE